MATNRSGSRGFLSSWPGRLYIAAVVMGSLALGFWLFSFIYNGGYSWRTGATVYKAHLIAPDRLDLIINSCNQNPEVSLFRETDIDVQIEVVADSIPPSYGAECLDAVESQLQEPLGGRDIVDARTGEVVRVQAEVADDGAAEMPDVPAPKIGDAPNEAELEDLQFIAQQKGISLQTAIERYGWHDNFSLAVAQIEEAVPTAFAGAEIVDDSSAWIAFNADAPQAARDIIDTFRSSHRGVSVEVRKNAGITQEELTEAIPIVHYAIYGAPEVRDAVTSFESETGHITTTVVLESGVPESAIEDLKAVAEAKLVEATKSDILDSVGVSVMRSEFDGPLSVFEGSRREHPGVTVLEARLISPDRLDLMINSCNRNPEVSLLRETDVDVQVEVVADAPPSLLTVQECDDHVEVQLQEPLGDRNVVDMRTGEVVKVHSR